MKVKKFNNLWTAGIILFISILISLHVINIIFPSFIVGVALTPTIISFGQLIDTNAYYSFLFYNATFLGLLYIHTCGCCGTKKLKIWETIILLIFVIIYDVLKNFLPSHRLLYFNSFFLILPLIIALIRKTNLKIGLIRIVVCSALLGISQMLIWDIRELSWYVNTSTYTVLLIDIYTISTLLYLYFNYKGDKKQ